MAMLLEIQAPYWLEAYDRRIDELRSALDQCKKKSKKIEVRVDTKTDHLLVGIT